MEHFLPLKCGAALKHLAVACVTFLAHSPTDKCIAQFRSPPDL